MNIVVGDNLLLKDSLVARWQLDQVEDILAPDDYGIAHGTYENAAANPWDTSNKKTGRSSASFDGVNDFIRCERFDRLEQSYAFSFAMWVYPTVFPSNMTAAARYRSTTGTNDDGWSMTTFDTGIAFVAAENGSLPTAVSSMTLNTWDHFIGVFDGPGGKIKMYKNGVIAADNVLPGSFTRIGNPDREMCLGAANYFDVDTFFWNGNLDYMEYYDIPFNDTQAAQVFNKANKQ